jgi:restriction endonuclease S subunit
MKQQQIYDMATGSAQKGINQRAMEEFEVIVPPLTIQHEIVATLDRFYAPDTAEIADTLKRTGRAMDLILAMPNGATLEPIVEAQQLIRKSSSMVEDIKAQMMAIMKSVGSRGFPTMKLSELCDYQNGKFLPSSDRVEDGDYDVMGGGMTYMGKTNKYNRQGETISISKCGSAGFVAYHSKKYWACYCLTLTPKENTVLKYIYYYLKLNKHLIMSKVSCSVIPHCKWSDIQDIRIAIPPVAFQEKIVIRLEAIQSQLTALESLQKQSEDNICFILDSYLSSQTTCNEVV